MRYSARPPHLLLPVYSFMRTRNSPELAQVLEETRDIAATTGRAASSIHLLLALFTVPNRAEVLLRDKRVTEDVVLDAIDKVEREPDEVIAQLVERAHDLAARSGTREVDCLHLLIAILRTRDVAAHRALRKTPLDVVTLRNQAMSYLTGHMPRRLRDAVPQRDPLGPVTEPVRGGRRTGAQSGAADPARQPRPTLGRSAGMPPPVGRREPPSAPKPSAPKSPAPDRGERADRPPRAERGAPLDGPERPDHTDRPDRTDRTDRPARAQRSEPPAQRSAPPPREAAGGRGAAAAAARTPLPAAPEPPEDDPFVLDPDEFPWLTSLGRNLTLEARDGRLDPLIGRDKEVEEVLDILGKRRTNNPMLVGEPGVGKTAIVEGLAQSLLELAERAGPLHERVVVELDMAGILAGTHLRGAFSERLNGIKDEVKAAGGRVIVFIDEIHTLIGAGATGEGAQDAANELKAALARGEFPCVGATTHDEYRRFIESDPALERRFTPVLVGEPSEADAIRILDGLAGRYGTHHGVRYTPAALEAAVRLSARYVTDRCLPDKAIGLLDLSGSRARREGRFNVEAEDIARVVSKTAGVPEERLLMTDQERFLKMEAVLAERLVGHSDILARCAQVVRRNYAGFNSRRPMGSFLFLGPTGVGKTELAKALAEFLYGSETALVRIDMSEYGEANTVSRLLGAPPGYVGYGEGGQLTEPVRRRPFSVVLLDEMEKAHRDVLQVLLQVLDEGHLTDGRGRQVSFTNTLVVLTSNLGADVADEAPAPRMGFLADDPSTDAANRGAGRSGRGAATDRILEAARKALAPELWNRIDERLVFEPLRREEVAEIARRLLADGSRRLKDERGIAFTAEDAVIEHLIAAGGFDAALGARPMRQTIQRLVEAPLAERILAGEIAAGDDVVIRAGDEGLRFERASGR